MRAPCTCWGAFLELLEISLKGVLPRCLHPLRWFAFASPALPEVAPDPCAVIGLENTPDGLVVAPTLTWLESEPFEKESLFGLENVTLQLALEVVLQ